jgi:hypothetical protein
MSEPLILSPDFTPKAFTGLITFTEFTESSETKSLKS